MGVTGELLVAEVVGGMERSELGVGGKLGTNERGELGVARSVGTTDLGVLIVKEIGLIILSVLGTVGRPGARPTESEDMDISESSAIGPGRPGAKE